MSLFAARFYAGTVRIDCRNVFDAAQPFGGYKRSGWGRENGYEGAEHFYETKTVSVNLG